MISKKCVCAGCKKPVAWEARKLWGKGGVIYTCDEHRPGGLPRPESLKNLPSFYEVMPIGREQDARS